MGAVRDADGRPDMGQAVEVLTELGIEMDARYGVLLGRAGGRSRPGTECG